MMKKALLILLILVSTCRGEVPAVNMPPAIRQQNWIGSNGSGSCVHASMIMLLRWQRRYETADYWKQNYSGGETWDGLTSKASNIRWAGTFGRNNVAFLEWACRTRRGCMVTCQGAAHMVVLVHLDSKQAGILDNNDPSKVIWKSREDFLQEWYTSSSWALTPVYTPPPPLLRRSK